MSVLAVLGLLWAAVGGLLVVQWWRAHQVAVGRAGAAPETASSVPRFGTDAEDRSRQRTRSMLGAYAAGALCCAVGFPTRSDLLLAGGAMLFNVGTVYRYLVVALDHTDRDLPLFDRDQPGQGLLASGLGTALETS